MSRKGMPRNANGRSSIFQSDADKSWHGYVTVGIKDNGKPDRRHVRGTTKSAVTEKVKALEKARDEGKIRRAGQTWTVAEWLTHWLDTIVAPPAITENAHIAYEVAARVHLIPGIGAHRIERLEPEHLEKLYRKMTKDGAKPGRVHQVHRTIRAALNEAKRRKHIHTNPAELARAPKLDEDEVEPYTVDEIKKILATARKGRNGTRWAIALALGLRQGEALGMKWEDVDLTKGTLLVRRSRLRPKFKHGCGTPCGRKYGGHCPQRVPLREETAATKSRAGRRGIGLPDQVVALLLTHKRQQDAERDAAHELWRETGYVLTSQTGEPLNPRTDWTNWKKLLKDAGVPERRLHDARHTAATVLLLLGVNQRAVMSVMGWSSTAMAARYQHVVDAVRSDIATQVEGLLWAPDDEADEGTGEPPTAA